MSIKECIDKFMQNQTNRGIRASTKRVYQTIFDDYIIPYIGTESIKNLTPIIVNSRIIPHLNTLNNRTIKKIITALKTMYKFALLQNYCQDTKLELLKVENNLGNYTSDRHLIMTNQQLKTFNKYVDTEPIMYQAIFTILEQTGMRIGELLGLQADKNDLDFKNQNININHTRDTNFGLRRPKTRNSIRSVSMSNRMKNNILKYIKQDFKTIIKKNQKFGSNSKLLFPIADSTIERHIRKVLVKAKMSNFLGKYTAHSFRRQFTHDLIKSGIDVATVSKYLGHANPEITMRIYDNDYTTNDRKIEQSPIKNFIEKKLS